jgi:hypothetical protein
MDLLSRVSVRIVVTASRACFQGLIAANILKAPQPRFYLPGCVTNQLNIARRDFLSFRMLRVSTWILDFNSI